MKSLKIWSLLVVFSFFSCKTTPKEKSSLYINESEEQQVVVEKNVDTISENNKKVEVVVQDISEKKEIKKESSTQEKAASNIYKKEYKEKIEEVIATENVENSIHEKVVEQKEVVLVKEAKKSNLKPEINHISSVSFREKITGKKVQLVDVRTPKEYNNERIEGAININYYDRDLFRKRMVELDKTVPVYIYCRSGKRSGKSAKILKNAGYKVYDLSGGILDWKKKNFVTIK